MGDEEPAEIAASNSGNGAELARESVLGGYLEWLEGRPLAMRSREAYGHYVRRFVVWLGGSLAGGRGSADQ